MFLTKIEGFVFTNLVLKIILRDSKVFNVFLTSMVLVLTLLYYIKFNFILLQELVGTRLAL